MAETKIDGLEIRVDPILATEAIKLQARLAKVAGTAMDRLPAIMRGAGGAGEEEKSASNAAAIAALVDICGRSDPDDISRLIADVVRIAHIRRPSGSYEPCDIDGDLSARPAAILPIVVFVLKTIFAGFFPAQQAPVKAAKATAA